MSANDSEQVSFASNYPVKVIKTATHQDIQEISVMNLLSSRQDVNVNGFTYYGWALPGTVESAAAWRISRLGNTGTVQILLWALGNTNFDKVWANRTSLSYL